MPHSRSDALNPTHARLTYPSQEILGAFADPKILEDDPDPRGIASAREAVSAYYAQRGFDVPLSRILLTASTSEAYGYLFKLLTDPGDDVLVPRPSYPLFEYLAAMESIHARQYPLRYDGGWHIDFEELERAIGARTRAILVVNPNNPTGSFLKQEELSRLDALAASRDLAILSDEVFSDFAFAPDTSRVTSLVGERAALTFSMSGLSKVAGLPQMKLGWIAASGPRHEEALLRLEWIADTYLSVATPVQLALPRLLAASAPVQTQILERAIGNLAVLKNLISERVPAQVLAVEGGWYAVVQIPRTRSEEDWTSRSK